MFRKDMTADQLTELFETADAFGVPDDLTPLMIHFGLLSKQDVYNVFADHFGSEELKNGITQEELDCFYYYEAVCFDELMYSETVIEVFVNDELRECLDKYGYACDGYDCSIIVKEESRDVLSIVSDLLNYNLREAASELFGHLRDSFFEVFPECLAKESDGNG